MSTIWNDILRLVSGRIEHRLYRNFGSGCHNESLIGTNEMPDEVADQVGKEVWRMVTRNSASVQMSMTLVKRSHLRNKPGFKPLI